MYSTIIKQLDASRRLDDQLKLERHQQELEKQKIDIQLESLRRSRKQFIDSQLQSSERQYAQKLREDQDVTREHLDRQKKSDIERSKIAQSDYERDRDDLNKQRILYEGLEADSRKLEKSIFDLQTRSKISMEHENRRLTELEIRKKQLLRLLQESKQRQLIHYERAKQLAL